MYLLLLTPLEGLIMLCGFRLQGFAEWERQSFVGDRMAIMVPTAIWSNRDALTEAHVP